MMLRDMLVKELNTLTRKANLSTNKKTEYLVEYLLHNLINYIYSHPKWNSGKKQIKYCMSKEKVWCTLIGYAWNTRSTSQSIIKR